MATKETWKKCIGLWKYLSEHPEANGKKEPSDIQKNRVLKKLGYRECRFGCPFCEATKDNCYDCPIGKDGKSGGQMCLMGNHPYRIWSEEKTAGNAKKMYNYLLALRRK